jgi:UDP-N-acetylglucosamine--N-acetylmuramyl-(pentapeptide) pyrophosphoryl-undecaprenol N-acetylglucosamine transferase
MVESQTTYRSVRKEDKLSGTAFRLLISGGGTGGHVFPAIAIADEVKALLPEAELFFIGAEGRIEMERVPQAGYPIEGLWISGFQRKLSFQNLLFPFKLIASLWKADRLIRRFRPDVVVGVGGYASGPTLNRAQARGIPTLIQEQNSFPGVTNRLLARRADKICVAYEGMERFFQPDKIILTGNPVRKDLLENLPDPPTAKQKLGLDPDRPLVVLIGGSLGARSLNDAMAASAESLKNRPDVQFIWQVGRLYEKEFQNTETARLEHVRAVAFLEDMPAIYAAADILICRAGALTLSEICLLGKASILVPSPNVAEDHQTRNARALSNREAAILIPDPEIKDRMVKAALDLLSDPGQIAALEKNARAMGKPAAGQNIAMEILKLGGRRNE